MSTTMTTAELVGSAYLIYITLAAGLFADAVRKQRKSIMGIDCKWLFGFFAYLNWSIGVAAILIKWTHSVYIPAYFYDASGSAAMYTVLLYVPLNGFLIYYKNPKTTNEDGAKLREVRQ